MLSSLLSAEYFQNFFDKQPSPCEQAIINLFTTNLIETIQNSSMDDETKIDRLRLIQTMTMMHGGTANRSNCLTEDELGGNPKRNELAHMIGLLTVGTNPKLKIKIPPSEESKEKIENFNSLIQSCSKGQKLHMSNFCTKVTADLVGKIYDMLSDDEKNSWQVQIGQTPQEIFDEVYKILNRPEEHKNETSKRKMDDVEIPNTSVSVPSNAAKKIRHEVNHDQELSLQP